MSMIHLAGRRELTGRVLRRITTLILALAVLGLSAHAAYADGSQRSSSAPNIVLIMADDMGYECVEANGGRSYRTPNLDRLAAEGVRFEHGYSQPICTPSRVQIMTGIYNQRNYIRFGLLDPRQTTFAQLLKKAGYATCIAGKWQLEGGFEAPRHFGFDEYCLWQLTRHGRQRAGRYPNPGMEINGKEVDYTDGEYGPDIACDYLCDFIERNKEGPFLAYYPMILPHWPFEPTPDSDDWDPEAEGVLRGHGQPKYFGDMVAYTDKMVGKIVDKLHELEIAENTLVLFTGDNGTATSVVSKLDDRTIRGGKGSTTDAGTRVPLIAYWPETIEAGRVSQALVDFSDFLPTLCEAAGASIPDDLEIDGRSFLPVLTGERQGVREWTYCWYARNGGPTGEEFARDQRYKLYRSGKFYDIADDPRENKPLGGEPLSEEADASKKKLQAVLDQMEGTRRLLKPGKVKG